ncbi:MAG: Clp1/GlmU family protein [Nitrososphaerales archaeon]
MELLTQLIDLMKSEILLVKGPASVKVKSGEVSVLGLPLKINQVVVVRKNKVLPFELINDSSIIITLGENGDYSVEQGNVGTKIWDSVVNRVFMNKTLPRKVILIGETDSGKSTLATYLINLALSKGLRVGIVDGDVGQNDLGPPGSVCAKIVEKPIFDLRDLSADRLNFIGVTSPRYKMVENILMNSLSDLVNDISRVVDLCIINTDGYVSEGGIEYKLNLVNNLKPDLIIYLKSIEGEFELYKRLIEYLSLDKVMVAERSKKFVKSRSERIERRVSQYHKFLRDSKRIKINLNSLKLNFLGNIYSENQIISEGLMKIGSNGSLIINQSMSENVIKIQDNYKIVLMSRASLQGMFIALGIKDCVKGFGIIQRVFPNFDTNILTPIEDEFDLIFLSLINLAPNLREEYIIPIVFS